MSVSYSRAPTNYSSQPPKTYKHTQECHFFVIDSENEEELQPKIAQSVELTDIEQLCLRKGRSQCYTHHNRYEEQCLDFQILTVQQQVRELQKECKVLEGFLSDMALQQAKIQVQMRIKERRKSVDMKFQQYYRSSQCPIHGVKMESLKSNLDHLKNHSKGQNENPFSFNDEISFTTPLLSRNHILKCQERLDQVKTVDVNDQSHKKMKQERPASHKKQVKDKENRASLKEKSSKKVTKKTK